MRVPQIEQDGGLFSLGLTGSSVDQQCRTDFCAPKYARDSFNLTTFLVDSGFLFDALSGAQRGESFTLGGARGREDAGTGWWWNDGVGVGKGREMRMPQIEQDGGLFSLGEPVAVSINNATQTFARRNMYAGICSMLCRERRGGER